MSDNPLIDTPEREERTRHRAYLLWQEDGCPDGRDKEFWERADFLIRMEDSEGAGQLPNPATQNQPIPGSVVQGSVECMQRSQPACGVRRCEHSSGVPSPAYG